MIDFVPSENDQKAFDQARASAMICRKYARHYDENEQEMAPEKLPEADEFYAEHPNPAPPGEGDSSMLTRMARISMINYWGDYTVRLIRESGGLGNAALEASGTPEQIAKWGKLCLSMAITAVLDSETNEWIINGEKIFVTTGIRADAVVLWATLDKSAGRGGIKSFLIEKGTPGFNVPHKEKKLGIRADDTAAYVFTDCRIPRDNLLGGDEKVNLKNSGGFRGVMKTFNMTRPLTAAMGLGLAEAALDFTREQLEASEIEIDYMAGSGSQTAAAEKFIRLEALFDASKLTTMQACWLAGEGKPNNMESSVCKAHAGGAVRAVTQGCIEILGAMGISREHLLEKWTRDCRITDIYEGTGEIQRLIIARGLLDYTRADLK
jgi:acyl-CoA dehydrogenase